MANEFDNNKFIRIKKPKMDEYPLTAKVKEYIKNGDTAYILTNDKGKMVGYYVFKLENQEFKLVQNSFENNYRKYIPAFEKKIIQNMREKILLNVTNKAVLKHYSIEARPTPIDHINLVMAIYVITIIAIVLTKQAGIFFLLGLILANVLGIKQSNIID